MQNCNRYTCKTSPCGGTGKAGDACSSLSHVNMAILNYKILYLCSKEQELEVKIE
jgi:hypothetical protein